jgi:hypothetical protein
MVRKNGIAMESVIVMVISLLEGGKMAHENGFWMGIDTEAADCLR